MRVEELTVEVRDENLNRVGQILPVDLVGFKAVLRFNNVGTWEIDLPVGHPMGELLRLPGYGLVVTGPQGVLLSGPTTSAENTKERGNPEGSWIINGSDDSIILGERLAYPTPATADVTAQTSAYDTVSNIKASTAMYGYINRNLKPGVAPTARAVTGLTLAADTSIGSLVTKSARFNVLGELLTELAVVDGLGFDIKQQDYDLVFSVYQPVDRSLEIRMDVANNTLSKTSYGYAAPGVTRAIVAGQGQAEDRTFVEVTTTDSTSAQALWARRIENFIDQRNTNDANELNQAGLERLAEAGNTITSVDVVPSSDTTMRPFVDWDLGDRVGVVIGGQEVAAVVTQIAITIESDGVRIGATVGEPTGVDYESLIAKRQQSTGRKINALERKESASVGGGIVESMPAGSIIAWGKATVPQNWLLCDGSVISRTTYASLFAAIGTTYGAGNGTTTFQLPDLRGRVPVGKNGGSFGSLGASGGEETVTLTAAQSGSPSHTHPFSGSTNTTGAHTHVLSGSNGGSVNLGPSVTSNSNGDFGYVLPGGRANSAGDHSHTFSGTTAGSTATNASASHTNVQPYQVVNYIIKHSAGETAGDSELATRVGVVESSVATKSPIDNPSFTGNVTIAGETYLNGTEIQGDGKTMLRYSDSWLRINEDNDFSSGIYTGTGILRTDGNFQVGASGSTLNVSSSTFNYNGLPAAGLVPVKPTSVYGVTNSIAANGRVSVTSGTGMYLNGIFTSKYRNYRIIIDNRNMGGAYQYFRFCYSDNNMTTIGAYYGGGFYRQGSSTGIWSGTGDGYSYGSIGYTADGGYTILEVMSPQWNGSYGKVSAFNSYGAGSHTQVWSDWMWNGWDAFSGIYIYNSGANYYAEVEVYGYNH